VSTESNAEFDLVLLFIGLVVFWITFIRMFGDPLEFCQKGDPGGLLPSSMTSLGEFGCTL
jgi:hypothetical protein